ncbi:MAG: hypothetical protein ACL7BU_00755 [Candidatus Phlomobacter fragariae]
MCQLYWEGIDLPHSLGILANKTVVVTIILPQRIESNAETKEVANVIFLLAISKADYKEAIAIYELFVIFIKKKSD